MPLSNEFGIECSQLIRIDLRYRKLEALIGYKGPHLFVHNLIGDFGYDLAKSLASPYAFCVSSCCRTASAI